MFRTTIYIVLVAFAIDQACAAAETPAESTLLTAGEIEVRLDEQTGAVAELSSGGKVAIDGGVDQYTLELPNPAGQDQRSDENDDRVLQTRHFVSVDGIAHTFFRCHNEKLNIWINKTYWMEPKTNALFKRIEIEADRGVDGFFIHESGVNIARDWWRGGSIWKPTWHEQAPAHRATETIDGEVNLHVNNAVRSALALYQPRRQESIVHWRWGGERFEYFESFIEKPPYGYRAWPGRWVLADAAGFIGGELNRRLTSQVVYGVIAGNPLDFFMSYVQREEFQRLCVEPMDTAPSWLSDTVIDDAFDVSHLGGNYKEVIHQFLEKKHPGYIQSVWWHPFPYEFYIARPEDNEPPSKEDPAASAKFIAEMQQVHPRFKLGPYTHFGHPSAHPDSVLAKVASDKGWIATQRDGQRVPMGADYNLNPDGAVPLNRNFLEYREHLLSRWSELFDYFGSDLFYSDSAPVWGRAEIDWTTRTNGSASIVQSLYRDMLTIAAGRGRAFATNYPVGFGTSGFSEFPWYPAYTDDWRFVSGRLAIQQALNFSPRRLYMCGYLHSSGSMKDDSIRAHVNYMTLLGIGFSLLDVKAPAEKDIFYREAAPYLAAAWEIRNRNMVDANVEPDWMALKGETEAYAWKSADGYGLVTAMSHDSRPTQETVAFDLEPLGIKADQPVYVWQMRPEDPRTADFSGDTWDSAAQRRVDQQLVVAEAKAPVRMEVDLELTHENPVALLVTDAPAVISAVDGRTCQYWLPASAYGVSVKPSPNTPPGRLSVMVENPGKQSIELLLLVPETLGETPMIQQRKWTGQQHAAGVAPGYDAVENEMIEVGKHRLLKLKLDTGTIEITGE